MSDLIEELPVITIRPICGVCLMCKNYEECKMRINFGCIWEAKTNFGNEKALCRKFEKKR